MCKTPLAKHEKHEENLIENSFQEIIRGYRFRATLDSSQHTLPFQGYVRSPAKQVGLNFKRQTAINFASTLTWDVERKRKY